MPEFVKLPVFGDENAPVDYIYPTQTDWENWPSNTRIKLNGFAWKNCYVLKALQLSFTSDIKTPFFEKPQVAEKDPSGIYAIKRATVDPDKRISQICIKLKRPDNILCGMRLMDDNGDSLLELEWQKRDDSEWDTRDVPAGKEIIGMYMSKSGDPEWIQSLGFILWTPCNP